MTVRAGPGFGLAIALAVAAHGFAGWMFGGGGGTGLAPSPTPHERGARPPLMVARILTAPPLAPTTTAVAATLGSPAPERISKPPPKPVATPANLAAKPAVPKPNPSGAPEPAAPSTDRLAAWQELALLPPAQYLPTSELEVPPLPRSAPDPTVLHGAVSSGLPIRLRLYIDELGVVANIEVLQASELDDDAVERMKRMFYDTRFLAGRRASTDVASFMDIEISLAELM